MIKIYCPYCNQKLGVPVEFSGKRVRCTQCKKAVLVPLLPGTPAAIAAIPPRREASQSNSTAEGNEDLLFSDMPETTGHGEENRLSASMSCPHCGTSISPAAKSCPACRKQLRPEIEYQEDSESAPSSEKWDFIRRLAGFPMSIGAGFITAILGAMAWAGIACAVQYEFGVVAWILGALIGFAMSIFTRERRALLGVIASLMAIFCILAGKYFIAKWYVLPEMQQEIINMKEKEEAKQQAKLSKELESQAMLSEEEIQALIQDSNVMFDVVCQNLRRKGEWTEEFANRLTEIHITGIEPQPQERQEIQRGIQKIQDTLGKLDEKQKRLHLLLHYADTTGNSQQLAGYVKEAFTDIVVDKIAIYLAFVASFSWHDILWIILAVGSAYKIPSGSTE